MEFPAFLPHRLKSQLAPISYCKTMSAKAVAARSTAFDRREERVETSAREIARSRFRHEPAVKCAPQEGTWSSRQDCKGQPAGALQWIQLVEPAFQRGIVLFQQQPGTCGAGEGIPLRCRRPKRHDVPPDPISKKVFAGVARVFAPGHPYFSQCGNNFILF